jgi:hypothetical protein
VQKTPIALTTVGWDILHPTQVSLKKKKESLPKCLWLPSSSLIPPLLLLLQRLSRGTTIMPMSWEKVIRSREATVVWESIVTLVRDAEDRATLSEKEA